MREFKDFPSKDQFDKGAKSFESNEPRDAMYKVATFLINYYWDKRDIYNITNALSVLLLTWNQAFYRYGFFDENDLEKSIKNNFDLLKKLRTEELAVNEENTKIISDLFNDFLGSLEIVKTPNGKAAKIRKSPVAVAKALHLLAPRFFPLWDYEIANKYMCRYDQNSVSAYIKFCKLSEKMVNLAKSWGYKEENDKSVLKLIDEYNYAHYTKRWDR